MSSDMATMDVIEQVLESSPLVGTAKVVPETELDHEGRYRRMPTGWGDLSD
jgi:hypothetical protein